MTHQAQVPPVTAHDRVSDVLARDASLVDVFVRHAPHFATLRQRATRGVMGRLVTVEQAANTAKVQPQQLVRELNEALGISGDPYESPPDAPPAQDAAAVAAASPPSTARVVELDVRDDLLRGREPFSRILSAVADLAADEVLHLRAIFEPVPLFTVMGKRGFVHRSESHAADDWSVWFWRPASASPAIADGAASVAPAGDASTTWLDVRGLSAPEPMLRTLTALEALPAGHVLVQVNNRVPQFLLPVLAERGFASEVDESRVDRTLVRIWHAR